MTINVFWRQSLQYPNFFYGFCYQYSVTTAPHELNPR